MISANLQKLSDSLEDDLKSIILQLSIKHTISDHITIWANYIKDLDHLDIKSKINLIVNNFGLQFNDYPFDKFVKYNMHRPERVNPITLALLATQDISRVLTREQLINNLNEFKRLIQVYLATGNIESTNIQIVKDSLNWNAIADYFIKNVSKASRQKVIEQFEENQDSLFLKPKGNDYFPVNGLNMFKLIGLGLKLEDILFDQILSNETHLLNDQVFTNTVREWVFHGILSADVSGILNETFKKNEVVSFLDRIRSKKDLIVLIYGQ